MYRNTAVAGYKNTLGSRKICSYNRYKLYSRYENRFPEGGSYIQNVLITGIHCIDHKNVFIIIINAITTVQDNKSDVNQAG